MKILLSFLLVTLISAVLAQSTTSVDISTSYESTTAESTTAESTTAESTTAESTTAEPTTAQPTTVESTTAESTTASSTTPSSTTAPVTTPFPAPATCSWNVTRENITCILVELKAQFIIPNESRINLGCGASTVGSDCSSNETQILVLSERNYYNLTMVFERDSKDKVSVRNITFSYTLPDGVKGSGSDVLDNLFNVKVGNSYLCNSETKVQLENVTMDIQKIQIQAFGKQDSQESQFGSSEECEADEKVNDVVPIAVGIALAALIIIVLIAYLVGRRRSRQRGYQSV